MNDARVTELTVHPMTDNFPLLSPEDYEALKWSIESHGLFGPIVFHNKKVRRKQKFAERPDGTQQTP